MCGITRNGDWLVGVGGGHRDGFRDAGGQLVQRIPSGPLGAHSSVLDRHSREFCVHLSGQVANSSARIRVEQATPAIHRDLMTAALGCEFFLILHSAVSPYRLQARFTSGQ